VNEKDHFTLQSFDSNSDEVEPLQIAFHLSGICLFGPEPANSREHFIPSAIGGQERPPILCELHNGVVAKLCDEPLLNELQFFVHALRVKKDRGRGEDGGILKARDASGEIRTIDRNYKPIAKRDIQRSPDGRPVGTPKFSNMKEARKFVKSRGSNPDSVTYRVGSEPIQPVLVMQHQVSEDIVRGVLKIAYEFVRGLYNAPVIDAEAELGIHRALIEGEDPSKYAQWLPYALAADNAVEFHHHRIMAWHDGTESLVIVQLFNCVSYVVRLPGVAITTAPYYVQGIHGQTPIFGNYHPIPEWHWGDVPKNAEIADQPEFGRRALVYANVITLVSLAILTREAVGEQHSVDGRVHDPEFIVATVESRCSRSLTVEEHGWVLHLASLCCSGPFGTGSGASKPA